MCEIYNNKYGGDCIGRVEGHSKGAGAAALLLLLEASTADSAVDTLEDDESEDEESDSSCYSGSSSYGVGSPSGVSVGSTGGGSGVAPAKESSKALFLVTLALIETVLAGIAYPASWTNIRADPFLFLLLNVGIWSRHPYFP